LGTKSPQVASFLATFAKRKRGNKLQDLRFAVRMLFKQPGFSLIAILTLALGVCATSAVFSLI
jgi:hypothetical protein